MALQKQALAINISAGLDTKTDSKHVIPGKLTKLENGVYRKGMALEKRRGYDKIDNVDINNTDLGTGSALEIFNDELLQYNNQKLYSYSENANKWIEKGNALTSIIQSQQIVKNTASQTQCDSAVFNGIGLYAWEDSRNGGSVRASVVDESTGSILLGDVLIDDAGERVKCLSFGGWLYVFYINGSDLYARRINPRIPSGFESIVTISTTVDVSLPVYDVINYQDLRILVAHNENTAATSRSIWLDEDLNILEGALQSRTYNPVDFDGCVAIVASANNEIFLVHWQGVSNSLRYTILNDVGVLINIGVTIETSGSAYTNVTALLNDAGDGVTVFYEVPAANPDEYYIKKVDVVGTSVGSITTFAKGVGLWTKAFEYTDENNIRNIFVGVTHESDLQSTYFVMRQDGLIVGKQQYTNGSGLTTRPLLQTVNVNGLAFSYSILKKNRIISENATIFTPTGVMRTVVDFTDNDRFTAKQIGNNLVISGGVLNMYDGQSIVEHGFLLYPERVVAAAVGSGGSLADGSYQIYVVYEWTDNFGQIHKSRPSVAQTVTCSAGGTDSITVTAPTLRLTLKQSGFDRADVSIVGYVTEANGSVPYRFTSVSSLIENNPNIDSISLGTITSVTTSNEILYTTGDVLANDPAPACSVIEVFQNRVWLAGLEEASAVVYSKENKTGFPVEFTDEFTKAVDSSGGRLKALNFIDDKILMFKADKAYFTYGDGPNDTNTLGGFAEIESISSDVGSENARSFTKLPNAIIFKSKKGFYSIDQTLSPSYIGADVEGFNDLTVTSSNILPDLNEVRFSTSDGDLLIYNYYFGKWSTASNLQSLSGVLWKNKLVLLKTDGTIFSQNTDSFKDANAGYGMKLESAWISLGNLNSYKRIYELMIFGNYKSNHKLRVKIAYNNDDSWIHSGVYDPVTSLPVEVYGDDSPYGETGTVYGGKPIDYAIRVRLKKQKCSSFRFQIEELTNSETTGTHEALVISDIGILAGMKQGAVKKAQGRNLKIS